MATAASSKHAPFQCGSRTFEPIRTPPPSTPVATVKLGFDDILRCGTLGDLQLALRAWQPPLSLPQAERLRSHIRSIGTPLQSLRLSVVHTYTSDLLDPWIELQTALEGFELKTYHAPYGLALQEARHDSALVAHNPDLTLLMLRREDLHPALSRPIVALDGTQRDAVRVQSLNRLREIVSTFRAYPLGQIALSLLPSPLPVSLGQHDVQVEGSETAWWQTFKTELGALLRREFPATTFIDLDEVQAHVGRQAFFDRRYWYSARYPFTAAAACEFARQIAVVAVLLKQPRAKVLVLDADNTLWGGIVGEDGIDGIQLGPDYPGNAYADFQRRVLDFQQRGVILAMCSKNNEADVAQVLREHPHQVLRNEHFAAQRVNWLPKSENLQSLAQELRLGLDTFIFVDDSDHECAVMRNDLPQVQVVQMPKRVVDVPTCLDHVARLEVLSLTAEDRARTTMYAHERQRRELLESASRVSAAGSDHLVSLQMKMRIGVDALPHLTRLAQLTKKTNQFNLTTRRHDEQQIRKFMTDSGSLVMDFSLADVFGDSGIVGLAIWRLQSEHLAELDTFLMSCRVIGRQAESAFLAAGLRLLAKRGITEIVADYVPTAKNELVREFLPQHGFATEGGRWIRRVNDHATEAATAYPIEITITSPSSAAQATGDLVS